MTALRKHKVWSSGTPGVGLVSFPDAARLADNTLPGWREELVPWPKVLLRMGGARGVVERSPSYAVLWLSSPPAEKVFERLDSPLDRYALEAAIGQRLLASLPAGAEGDHSYQDSWVVIVPAVRGEADLRALGEHVLDAFTRPLDPSAALLRFFAHGGIQWMPKSYAERPFAEVLAELALTPLVCPVRLGAALGEATGSYEDTLYNRARTAHHRLEAAPGFDLEPLSEQRRLLSWNGSSGFRNRRDALEAAIAAALGDADTTILVCDGGPRLAEAAPEVREWVFVQAYRPALESVFPDECLFELPGEVFVAVLPRVSSAQVRERGSLIAAAVGETECSIPDTAYTDDAHERHWLPIEERFPARIRVESAVRGSDPRALLEAALSALAARREK